MTLQLHLEPLNQMCQFDAEMGDEHPELRLLTKLQPEALNPEPFQLDAEMSDSVATLLEPCVIEYLGLGLGFMVQNFSMQRWATRLPLCWPLC